MTTSSVAIVGTGADPENPTADGFAMAYRHADAYSSLETCELIACADIVRDNAEAFATVYNLDDDHVYEDYEVLLAEVSPDIVSICVPPIMHAEIAIDCARSGVDAIHCEKPMALTWGGARRMADAADRHNVKLTFNHQRRFGTLFREAKQHLDAGLIGDLQRIEYTWGNFYDNGTHCVDMCNYFNNEHSAEWVIGQLDYRKENILFGTHNENQMFAQWRYDNGVYGMVSTGTGAGVSDGDWHLYGSDGEMAISLVDELALEVRHDSNGWEKQSFEQEGNWIERAITDVIDATRNNRTSELCAQNALRAMEIIFGGYESVRRRSRVHFPLKIDDNPLAAMVESNKLSPSPINNQ